MCPARRWLTVATHAHSRRSRTTDATAIGAAASSGQGDCIAPQSNNIHTASLHEAVAGRPSASPPEVDPPQDDGAATTLPLRDAQKGSDGQLPQLLSILCRVGAEYVEGMHPTSPATLEVACHRLMLHLAKASARSTRRGATTETVVAGPEKTQQHDTAAVRSANCSSSRSTGIDVQLSVSASGLRRRPIEIRLADLPTWLTDPIADKRRVAPPPLPLPVDGPPISREATCSGGAHPYALFGHGPPHAMTNVGMHHLASDVPIHRLEQLLYALRHLRQQQTSPRSAPGTRITTTATWLERNEIMAHAEATWARQRLRDPPSSSPNRHRGGGGPVRVVTLRYTVVEVCEAIAFRVFLYKGFAQQGGAQRQPATPSITAVHGLRRVLGWEDSTCDALRDGRRASVSSTATPFIAFPANAPTTTVTLVAFLALQACSLDDLYHAVPAKLLPPCPNDAAVVPSVFRRGVRMAIMLHVRLRWVAQHHDGVGGSPHHASKRGSAASLSSLVDRHTRGGSRGEDGASDATTTPATRMVHSMKHLTQFFVDRLQRSRRVVRQENGVVGSSHRTRTTTMAMGEQGPVAAAGPRGDLSAWPEFTADVDEVIMLWLLVLTMGPSLERMRPRTPPRIWERLILDGVMPVLGWVLLAKGPAAPGGQRHSKDPTASSFEGQQRALAVAWAEWGDFTRDARLEGCEEAAPPADTADRGAPTLPEWCWPISRKDAPHLRVFLLHCFHQTLNALGGEGTTATGARHDASASSAQQPTISATAVGERHAAGAHLMAATAARGRHNFDSRASELERTVLLTAAFFFLRGSLLRMGGVFSTTPAALSQLGRDTDRVVEHVARPHGVVQNCLLRLENGTHVAWPYCWSISVAAALPLIVGPASPPTASSSSSSVSARDGGLHDEAEDAPAPPQPQPGRGALDLLDPLLVRSIIVDAQTRCSMRLTQLLCAAHGGASDGATTPPGGPPLVPCIEAAPQRNVPSWAQLSELLERAVRVFATAGNAGCLDRPAFVPPVPFPLVMAMLYARIGADAAKPISPLPQGNDLEAHASAAAVMAHVLAYMHWCALCCGGVSHAGLWSHEAATDPDTGSRSEGAANDAHRLASWAAMPTDDRDRVADGIRGWFAAHIAAAAGAATDDGRSSHRSNALLQKMTTVSLLQGVRMGMMPLAAVAEELYHRWVLEAHRGARTTTDDDGNGGRGGIDAILQRLEQAFSAPATATSRGEATPAIARDGVQDLLTSWAILSLEEDTHHNKKGVSNGAEATVPHPTITNDDGVSVGHDVSVRATLHRMTVAMIALNVCSGAGGATAARTRRLRYMQLHALAQVATPLLPESVGWAPENTATAGTPAAAPESNAVVRALLSASPHWNPRAFLFHSLQSAIFCTEHSASSPDVCVTTLASLVLGWSSLLGCAENDRHYAVAPPSTLLDAMFGADERRVRITMQLQPTTPYRCDEVPRRRLHASDRSDDEGIALVQQFVQLLRRALLSIELSTTAPGGGGAHPTALSTLVCTVVLVHRAGLLCIEDLDDVLGVLARTWSALSAAATTPVPHTTYAHTRRGSTSSHLRPPVDRPLGADAASMLRCALLIPVAYAPPMLPWLAHATIQWVRLSVVQRSVVGAVSWRLLLRDVALGVHALARIAMLTCEPPAAVHSDDRAVLEPSSPPAQRPSTPSSSGRLADEGDPPRRRPTTDASPSAFAASAVVSQLGPRRPVHHTIRLTAYQLVTWWLHTAAPRLMAATPPPLTEHNVVPVSPLDATSWDALGVSGQLVQTAMACNVVLRADEVLGVYALLADMMRPNQGDASHGRDRRTSPTPAADIVVILGHVAGALVALHRACSSSCASFDGGDDSNGTLLAHMHLHTKGRLRDALMSALRMSATPSSCFLTGTPRCSSSASAGGAAAGHGTDALQSAFDAFVTLWMGDEAFWANLDAACSTADGGHPPLVPQAVARDAQRRACVAVKSRKRSL